MLPEALRYLTDTLEPNEVEYDTNLGLPPPTMAILIGSVDIRIG
jgi:hypothetical protein